jgi:LmbE family N-acetylglucosaminyl deacetylase
VTGRYADGVRTALVVHAHPDDETFANSARILQLAAQGYRVVGVVATGGEAGELRAGASVGEARRVRIAKYEHALDVLGASAWGWLDSGAEWVDGSEGPRVGDADPAHLRSAVTRVVEEQRPDMVLTVG